MGKEDGGGVCGVKRVLLGAIPAQLLVEEEGVDVAVWRGS